LGQAQTETAAILDRNRMQHEPDSRGLTALITPLAGTMNAQPRKPLLLLLAAAALVLLIACSNVAGLLMARAAGREHEITVREALGAQRTRLVRQLLTESLLLAVGSGALGVGVAYAAVRAIAQLNSGNIPRVEAASVNSTALLFTLGVSLLTSILFGLAPALAASRSNLREILAQSGGRGVSGSRGLHQSLIVAEMGLCIVLLAASGLFIRSLMNVNRVDKGFEPQATLTASIALDQRYTADKPEKFFREVSRKVAELPGVRAVAVTDGAPLTGYESIGDIGQIEGHAFDKSALFESRHVTLDYFAVLGIPVLEGRSFTEDDAAGKPAVIIVSRSFARQYFPDSNAVGKRVYPVNQDGTPAKGQPATIVGVVSDVHEWSLEQTPVPQVYKPMWQSSGWQRADVVVRTAARPADLAPQIRDIVRGIDPAVAVADVRTMSDLVTSATSARRFQTVLLVSFAGIALFLALVGLYALMAYSVRQRTYEIGIRMALGAARRDVLRLVLRYGLKLALAGALLGLAGSLAAARLIERFLFGVKPLDPPTLAATVALLVCVSLVACMVPARRATRVDPMVALRHQ
jgi:putative ABC transport system permease protein